MKHILLLFFTVSVLNAQKSYSLKEAIESGLKNDLNLKNVKLDLEKTKQKNKQVAGSAYPQISASGNLVYNYIIPTTLVNSFNPLAPPGQLDEIQFGLGYNFGGQIEATQLLFEPNLLAALLARKTIIELSSKNIQRTELDLKEAITKAYYSVLVNLNKLELIEENIKVLSKTKKTTEQLYINGFVEKIDLERLTLSLKTLESQKNKVKQFIALAEDLLKFQIGEDINEKIILTDKIKEEDINSVDLFLAEEIKAENTVDFELLSLTKKLKEFGLKKENFSFLPTLVGFANYGYNGPTNNFNNVRFFNQGAVGLSINMPIFSGFTKTAKIDESKLEIEQSKNNIELVKKQYQLKNNALKANLKSAIDTYKIEKESIVLAEKLYKQSQKKYEIGTGGSLEIVNAYKDLVEIQTNYTNALYEIIIHKTEFLKNLNKL